MKSTGVIPFYAASVFGVISVIVSMLRTKRFLLSAVLSVLGGVGALFAVNLVGSFITVHIPVNAFSLCVSSLGGVPGVILMLLVQVIFL